MPDRKQEIVTAALAIADEKGLAGVTMRAVAQRVGVTPMALYSHVAGKEGLLDLMLGQLLGEIPLPASGAWEARLTAIAVAARNMAKRHPGAAALAFSRPSVTPDAVRVVDAVYLALLDAGVPPPDVPRVERMVSTLVLGYAASEVNGRFSPGTLRARERRSQLPEGQLPGHELVFDWLEKTDWDAEFEADLRDLKQLIQALAQS